MRDQGGGGLLLSPPSERKKVSVKLSGRDEGSEVVRRRAPGYEESSSYGGGGGTKLMGSVVPVGSNGRLKGGSSIPSSSNGVRQHNDEIHFDRLSGAAKAAAEEAILPQWGRGKRSRCSRLEPNTNKHSASSPLVHQESLSPSKPVLSTAPTNKPLANAVPCSKLRSHGPKLPPSKLSAPERPLSRNGLLKKTANGAHTAAFESSRQIVEVKETLLSQHRRSADYGSSRQQQRSEGSDFATTNGQGHCADNATIINHANHTNWSSGIVAEVNAVECHKTKVEWPRIAIALTRKEKEEDFLIFKGTKLPQRPKKRLKVVEKALLFCTPGNWLVDLSRGRYDVREKKSTKKKPRGLKAMDSVESDSE